MQLLRRLCRSLVAFSLSFSFAPMVWAAVDIQFDYSYDATGFFSGANAGRRAVLEAAAAVFESRLTQESFGPIVPSGRNTWSMAISNPSTGRLITIDNPVVPANTVVIYVGASDLGGAAGIGSSPGYGSQGDSAWIKLISARDSPTNFEPIGGAISFDPAVQWHFDADPATFEAFQGFDFYSVAVHEIGHILGFGSARAFTAKVFGSQFTGANARALYGGNVPLDSADRAHWASGVMYGGQETAMDPEVTNRVRNHFTELDFAALKDIGYNVSAVASTPTTPATPPVPPQPEPEPEPEPAGNPWDSFAWLGSFTTESWPWIYQEDMGWVYVAAEGFSGGYYLYPHQSKVRAMWTSAAEWPRVHTYSKTKALSNVWSKVRLVNGKREFYVKKTKRWIKG